MLIDELNFFKENQDDLVNSFKGKILVIKGREIIGVYKDTIEAYKEAIKENELGSFMLQPCEPGPEAYTVTINTSGIATF